MPAKASADAYNLPIIFRNFALEIEALMNETDNNISNLQSDKENENNPLSAWFYSVIGCQSREWDRMAYTGADDRVVPNHKKQHYSAYPQYIQGGRIRGILSM